MLVEASTLFVVANLGIVAFAELVWVYFGYRTRPPKDCTITTRSLLIGLLNAEIGVSGIHHWSRNESELSQSAIR